MTRYLKIPSCTNIGPNIFLIASQFVSYDILHGVANKLAGFKRSLLVTSIFSVQTCYFYLTSTVIIHEVFRVCKPVDRTKRKVSPIEN